MDEAARHELLRAKAELEAQAPPGIPPDPIAAKLGKGKSHGQRPR